MSLIPRSSSGRPRQELPWGGNEQQQQNLPPSSLLDNIPRQQSQQQHQKQQFQQNPILAYSNRPSSTMSEFTPHISSNIGLMKDNYYSQQPLTPSQHQQQKRPSSAMLGSSPTKLPYYQHQQQRQQQHMMNMSPLVRPSSNPTPSRLRSPHLAFGKCSGTLSRPGLGGNMK